MRPISRVNVDGKALVLGLSALPLLILSSCGGNSVPTVSVPQEDVTLLAEGDEIDPCLEGEDVSGCGLDARFSPGTETVFINELHYDNAGGDVNESVEIAGPAGTNLSGWQLVFYNGSNGETYDTEDLTGTIPNLDGSGFGVLAFPVSGIQNGSPDGIALVNAGSLVQFLSYEGSFTATHGPASGQTSTDIGVSESSTSPATDSLQLQGTGNTYGDFTWAEPAPATPGSVNNGQVFRGGGPGGGDITLISTIQGNTITSPLVGQTVTIEGIVTGVFEDLGGFFVQEEPGDADGDEATSEGIFVFTNFNVPSSVGGRRRVQVTGTVAEFGGDPEERSTQLVVDSPFNDISVNGFSRLPSAVQISLPAPNVTFFERYEGMRVRVTDPLFVTDTFNLGAFGEVLLSQGGVLDIPTNVAQPGAPANALQAQNDLRKLILDDGASGFGPVPVPYIGGSDQTLRRGSRVSRLIGILNQGFDTVYRIQPSLSPQIQYDARAAAPSVFGDVTVAAFNVLNYFTTLDNGSNDARGADSAAELQRQVDKLVAALTEVNADIVGLIEVENNQDTSITTLVNALNAELGAGTYAVVPRPAGYGSVFGGDDEIRVGLIYKPSTVQLDGAAQTIDDPAFARARAPIAQTFQVGSERFTVMVNHFKSKSCSNASGSDTDQGDGQGCFNATRTQEAQAVVNFTNALQTSTGDSDVYVIGDLNAYREEDPLDVLRGGGLQSVDSSIDGDSTFVFFGQGGSLDYLLGTLSARSQVTSAAVWEINASEPRTLDYNDAIDDSSSRPDDLNLDTSLYRPDAFRSSDHDILYFGINL